MTAATAFAQPRFETASVKPAPAASGWGGSDSDPTLYQAHGISLANLIGRAYGTQFYSLDGPAWMRTEHYEVIAKVPAGASKDQLPAMLQDLLIHRFHLEAHREPKQMSVYLLQVGKTGLKIKEAASAPAAPGEQRNRTDKNGEPVFAPGMSGAGTAADGAAVRHFGSFTMDQLASSLSVQLLAPVFDETGLKGKYDVTVRYFEDTPAGFADALQAQSGLLLKGAKRPVEVLVVDRVDRVPVEN